MRVDLFDFDLPEDHIALRPASPRDSAKMLVVTPESETILTDYKVSDIPSLLRKGDALVFNDTKVIPAQLEGVRERDGAIAKIGATLHMRMSDNRWRAFVRGAKKLRIGDRVRFGSENTGNESTAGLLAALDASVSWKGEEGEVELAFDLSGIALDEALVTVGHVPLPPYIALKRGEDERDREDYQTIYAENNGAVAAPTAGLHFTDELMKALDEQGISRHFVTLHVGAGTFLPVKAQDTKDHKMHHEIGEVSQETANALNQVRENGGRIVSVGTTSLRLLESAASESGKIQPYKQATDIFITPGYDFRAVDILMTNFHLPKSTLFMLVSAFSGLETMQKAYSHAIQNNYRFYSYGDSSLLFRKSAGSQND